MSTPGDIWGSTPWPNGWDVRHVAETGSTNADLIEAMQAGTAGDRTVLATDHQTAGRGRLDRRWDAPPGANLLVSIAVSPVPDLAVEATHRVGLAAVAAVRRFVGREPETDTVDVALKWPNDVLLDGRKLAGILAQRCPSRDAVVVGLGLNVSWAPEGAAALSEASFGVPVTTAQVLHAVLEEFDSFPNDITSLYRSNLATLGQDVRVELPGDLTALVGRAIDVDALGRLVVVDNAGVRHELDVGDVVHVRPGESSV